MQTASTRASLGLSTGSPFTSMICIQGKVLRHIPMVEIRTRLTDKIDTTLAACDDWGFSNKSQRSFWYLAK